MRRTDCDPLPGSRFGLAGAAAMVAICVTTLALTAAGPPPAGAEAAGAPAAPPAASCQRCGRALDVAAESPPGDAFVPRVAERCGDCGH